MSDVIDINFFKGGAAWHHAAKNNGGFYGMKSQRPLLRAVQSSDTGQVFFSDSVQQDLGVTGYDLVVNNGIVDDPQIRWLLKVETRDQGTGYYRIDPKTFDIEILSIK